MNLLNIWTILGIVSFIILITYFRRGKNAVWGGFTIGIIIGLVIFLFSGFNWGYIIKSSILGAIIGYGSELLGKLSDRLRK